MSRPRRKPTAAQRAAYTIMLIGLVALAFSLPLTLAGQVELALQVCAGGAILGVVVLFIGAASVALSRPDDTQSTD